MAQDLNYIFVFLKFFGFALLCVYIAYERLCNRW